MKIFLTRSLLILIAQKTRTSNRAQCYPRLACALNGALIMQVHQGPEAVPALALTGKSWSKKRMQIHAPDACRA
ncbi:hypothetical protein [Enterobacter sp. DNB-S2]|jgi:hypothetical protein|uniref:hypothetical protein n=1 Tax=Enterobacter sp. DNB-S2 TaxID=2720029 RepID=UPI001C632B61|nr:hypothetical protein [Enterobacter sp. DNB-S2]